MKSNWLKIVSIVLILVVLSGCAAKPAAATPAQMTELKIGTQPWIGYGPWWIAKEKGLFEKYNLKVELVDFAQDQDVNAALASGQMDAANLATHTAIKLYSAGLDLRIVLLEDASYKADAILTGEGVSKIEDLKGKSIGYEEGTTSDLLLNFALSQAGMTTADVKVVPMPASDAGMALISGNIDAAVTYEPYITEALQQNSKLKSLVAADTRPGLISDVLVVSAKFAQENPAAVKALTQVWDEALSYYKTNPQDAKAIIATAVGSKPEELETAFEGVQFFDRAQNQSELTGKFLDTLKDVTDVATKIGMIKQAPDLSKLVDATSVKD